MGIDPVTHKPFSHLMAEIATTLAPPQVAHLTEAALGCFKDEMLHLLTKKRVDFHMDGAAPSLADRNIYEDDSQDTVHKIKLGVSRAMQDPNNTLSSKPWAMVSIGEASNTFAQAYTTFPTGFQYGPPSCVNNDGDGSPWNHSICTGSNCTGTDQRLGLQPKSGDEDGDEPEGRKAMRKESDVFSSDCVLWDLTDDLINPAA